MSHFFFEQIKKSRQQEKQWEKEFYLISKYHEEMFGPIVVTRYPRWPPDSFIFQK